ncbi:hypothetical protein AAEO56_18465 [Flavobacterium sp. DGU11]|uniref:Addiction module antitoxin RelB n=1 Tax=Flavobacterium arundinis TaxID=3139143 RepID=A0ABU9I2J7_9FLAO
MDSNGTKEWDELSPELRAALEISIEQSLRGKVRPHEEVMAEIRRKYNIA